MEFVYNILQIGLFTFGGGYAMIPLLSAELAKRNDGPPTKS